MVMKFTKTVAVAWFVCGAAACGGESHVAAQAVPTTERTSSPAETKPNIPPVAMTQPKGTTPATTVDTRPDFVDWPTLPQGASMVGREFGSIRSTAQQKVEPPNPLPLPLGTQSIGGRLIGTSLFHIEVVSTAVADSKDLLTPRPLLLLLVETIDRAKYRAVVRAELFDDVLQPGEVPDIWTTVPGSSCALNGKADDELLAIVVPKRSGDEVTVDIKRAYRFSVTTRTIESADIVGLTCPALQGGS
jgi:hypothetical protein